MGRFWEYYLVRYLAGNIFGVIVIFYLFANHSEKITNSFYGYENAYKEKNITKDVFNFVFQVDKNIVFDGNTSKSKLVIESVAAENIKKADLQITELTFVGVFVIGVFGFLYMYLSSLPIYLMHIFRSCVYKRDWSQYAFYDGLATYRTSGESKTVYRSSKNYSTTNTANNVKEYVESYRHMREHGNAFFIIVFEIVFAWLLIQTNFSVRFILVWVAIGSSGWFFSHYLELKAVIGQDNTSNKSLSGALCCAFIIAILILLFFVFLYAH